MCQYYGIFVFISLTGQNWEKLQISYFEEIVIHLWLDEIGDTKVNCIYRQEFDKIGKNKYSLDKFILNCHSYNDEEK